MKYEVISAQLEPPVLGWNQNCFVFTKNESGDIDQFIVSRHGEILDSGEMEFIPGDLQKTIKTSAIKAFESTPNQLATIENLLICTQHFFNRHWNQQFIGIKPPKWSDPSPIKENCPLPNHDKQGVYAFVKDHDVTYIGVATSKGSGPYRGHGIGNRFQAYAKYVNGQYQAIDVHLKEAGKVMTIGFEIEEAYLANALELYLIAKLNPKYNSNHPGS